jgi:hypothetical protein
MNESLSMLTSTEHYGETDMKVLIRSHTRTYSTVVVLFC